MQTLIHSAVFLLVIHLAVPGSAQQAAPNPQLKRLPAAEASSRGQPPAGEQSAGEAPAEALTLEQLESELRAVEEQTQLAQEAVTPQRAQQLGVSEEELRERVALQQSLENVIQRRITALKRLTEVRNSLQRLQQEAQAPPHARLEAEAPYPLSVLDSLRDDMATGRREVAADGLSLDSLQASVSQAQRRLDEAQRNRRQAQDQLEAEDDEASRAPLFWQQTITRLKERLAEHELAHAKTQLELAQQTSQVNQQQIQLLESQIAHVEKNAVFAAAELEENLAEFQSRRVRLEDELRALRRADQANQARLQESHDALGRARGEDEIRVQSDVLAAREAQAETSSRGVELLQERINNIDKFKALWQRRFDLTQDPSEGELAEWQRETKGTLDEISRRREETERQLQTLRTTRLDIENRLADWDPAQGDKSEVEARLRALQQRESQETDYLASLLSLERLAQRVAEEIQDKRRLDSWGRYWSRFVYWAGVNWRRELFVIEDRAFRLGQLIWAGIVFCLVLLAAWVGRKIVRRTVLRHLRRHAEASQTLVDDSILAVTRQTKRLLVFFVAAYLALISLPLSGTLEKALHSFAIIALTIQVALWANAALKMVIDKTRRRRVEEDPSAASAFGLMSFLSRVAVWSAALLLILTNLGYEIGPLLAGLGVGGVAVAFALQSILGDIFCSIAIVLDKPFVIGDFIIVGDLMGTVENIGIKTTRIRSLSGEQIIFSNADLMGSRVRNYKRMYERRVVFAFGVVYETPLEKLQQIPDTVRTIIQGIAQTRFDRAHFKQYGDFSLDFEVVYYVLVPDYNVYMDIQQEINLQMFRAFQEQGVAFAYPTREIIVRPNGQAKVSALPHAH